MMLAISFNPGDSIRLATTGGDRSIHLWDFASQKERPRLQGASEAIEKRAFAPPDGPTIATGGHGNPITLWNVAQSKSNILAAPTKPRSCVLGYSQDGTKLLTIDAAGQVMSRDPNSLAVVNTVCQVDRPSALMSGPPSLQWRKGAKIGGASGPRRPNLCVRQLVKSRSVKKGRHQTVRPCSLPPATASRRRKASPAAVEKPAVIPLAFLQPAPARMRRIRAKAAMPNRDLILILHPARARLLGRPPEIAAAIHFAPRHDASLPYPRRSDHRILGFDHPCTDLECLP